MKLSFIHVLSCVSFKYVRLTFIIIRTRPQEKAQQKNVSYIFYLCKRRKTLRKIFEKKTKMKNGKILSLKNQSTRIPRDWWPARPYSLFYTGHLKQAWFEYAFFSEQFCDCSIFPAFGLMIAPLYMCPLQKYYTYLKYTYVLVMRKYLELGEEKICIAKYWRIRIIIFYNIWKIDRYVWRA